MPTELDDNKRTQQFLLVVQGQDPLELSVHCILGRGQDAEIDDTCPTAQNEDQPPEIAVARDEDTALILGHAKQFKVLGLGQTNLSNCNDIVAPGPTESGW